MYDIFKAIRLISYFDKVSHICHRAEAVLLNGAGAGMSTLV